MIIESLHDRSINKQNMHAFTLYHISLQRKIHVKQHNLCTGQHKLLLHHNYRRTGIFRLKHWFAYPASGAIVNTLAKIH